MVRRNTTFIYWAMIIAFLFVCSSQPALAQSSDALETQSTARIANKSEDVGASVSNTEIRTAKPAPPPSSSWNGFYVGGFVGGNWGRATADTSTVFSPTGYFAATSVSAIATAGRQNLNPSGFNGGGQVGYNYQAGHFVVGAEGDFGWMTGKKTQSTTVTYPCCSPTAFTITQSVKTNWVSTVRGRAGYAAGNLLVYATGGVAFTDLNYSEVFTDTFATANEGAAIKKTRTGWTGGGGVEYKFGKWSAKGEYLFADFGRATTTSTNLSAPASTSWPTSQFTHSVYLKEHLVRFGLNYHF